MPFTTTLALLLGAAIIILWIVAIVRREQEKTRRLALAASINRHPAGKALDRSESRHLDTPGYDWVNGDL
jgi:hypothetical protein